MPIRIRVCWALLVLIQAGCSAPVDEPSGPVDPQAEAALRSHWDALRRHDWNAGYQGLHPELRNAGLTLKRFTDLHSKRRGAGALPGDIRITGAEPAGDDLVISFDLLAIPLGGGEPVALSPRRKVMMRRSADSWRLMAPDILALRP